MNSFRVSVIIPVFNACDFVKEAVESAICLDEVAEIILVEDNSSDNSLEVCRKLALNSEKVSLYRHPGGVNKGESASRNLGISKASCQLIAFLDADDWYYPIRFSKDKEIFAINPEVKITYSYSTINFPNGRIIPYGSQEDLLGSRANDINCFEAYQYVIDNDLVLGHVNANSVHVDVFKNGDLFDERLKVHADTEFWWRINRKYKFIASELNKPVSAARRHDHNTIYNKSIKTKIILLLVWMDNIGLKNLKKFEKKAVSYQVARAFSNPIKNTFLRKSILFGLNWLMNLTLSLFISLFYKWGMRKFNLYKV